MNEVEILLVEDNPHDLELTMRALRKNHLANSITTVSDGEAALDFLFARGEYSGRDINSHPRVVFLDLKLPKIDGIEVLRKVKLDERTRTIPIVVVTGTEWNAPAGVVQVLRKPITMDVLIGAVQRAISPPDDPSGGTSRRRPL